MGMAVFLLFHTAEMIQRIPVHPWLDTVGPALFFSWYVSLCVTGIFAFSGFVFPTEKLLPTIYYLVVVGAMGLVAVHVLNVTDPLLG